MSNHLFNRKRHFQFHHCNVVHSFFSSNDLGFDRMLQKYTGYRQDSED